MAIHKPEMALRAAQRHSAPNPDSSIPRRLAALLHVMEQQEARQEQQLAPSNGAHKLDALAEQEKNLAIFKTISSWLSSVVLRGHVLSYYVRPDRDKTDQ